jgi:long-chain acyl-CoA synthetase
MATTAATLAKGFEQQTQKYGQRAFLRDRHDGKWRDHSWNEVAEKSARLRAGLIKSGLKPGERVAILSDNSPEWVVVDLAVLGAGGIVVPLYTTSGIDETRHVIADSGARVVAGTQEHRCALQGIHP